MSKNFYKFKICYVSNSLIPSHQANSVHVMNMVKALHKLKVLESFYAYKGKKGIDLKKHYNLKYNIKPNNYFFSQAPFFNFLESLFFSLRKKKNVVLVGRNIKICLLQAILNKKVIFETHQPFSHFTLLERVLLKYCIKKEKLQHIICITQSLKEILIKEVKNTKVTFHVLPDSGNINSKIRQIKKKSTKKKIGYTGSLIAGRGIDVMIHLAKIMKNVDFHLAGGDKYLIEKIKDNNNHSNLFFHGYLTQSELISFRDSMDILIAPYQINTQVQGGKVTSKWMSPLKIFEYMSSRNPMIVSNIKVLREVLINKKNCILVNPNKVFDWKTAIEMLIKNNSLAQKISNQAFLDLKTKYSWDIRAKKIIDIAKLAFF